MVIDALCLQGWLRCHGQLPTILQLWNVFRLLFQDTTLQRRPQLLTRRAANTVLQLSLVKLFGRHRRPQTHLVHFPVRLLHCILQIERDVRLLHVRVRLLNLWYPAYIEVRRPLLHDCLLLCLAFYRLLRLDSIDWHAFIWGLVFIDLLSLRINLVILVH